MKILLGVLVVILSLFCTEVLPTLSVGSTSVVQPDSITAIADRVWTFSRSRPDGFTLDIRTMTEPTQGIAVSYAATQHSHLREQLDTVVRHALQHDGYVGGWYDSIQGKYCFDSTRLFPENKLSDALQFAKDNGQFSVYILSTSTEIPLRGKP